jgi:hypothetical protein
VSDEGPYGNSLGCRKERWNGTFNPMDEAIYQPRLILVSVNQYAIRFLQIQSNGTRLELDQLGGARNEVSCARTPRMIRCARFKRTMDRARRPEYGIALFKGWSMQLKFLFRDAPLHEFLVPVVMIGDI